MKKNKQSLMLGAVPIVAVGLSVARAGLMAVKDGYWADGWHDMALRSYARDNLSGLMGSAALALVSYAIARSGRTKLGLAVLVAGGFAFVSARLPASALHIPAFESRAGRVGNAAALGVACVSALLFLVRSRRALWTLLAPCVFALGFSVTVVLRQSASPASWPQRPNLVLVSLDTLRASALGAYGYPKPTSPNLDRFAEKAVLFESAFTPFPWTLVAHGTMLTSLTPTSHGMGKLTGLPDDVPTLAQLLQDAGYQTAALYDERARWLLPDFGLDSGFQRYRSVVDSTRPEVTGALLDDLGEAPFFLFLHCFDVHSDDRNLPYEARAEDLELFVGSYAGDLLTRDPGMGAGTALLSGMQEHGVAPTAEDVVYLRGLYDAGVRTMDREIGRFLADLGERGLMENTVVVVTADHGENFYEHGVPLHHGYWDESVQVPLMIRTPETSAPARVGQMVDLGDIAATLMSYAGLPTDGFSGTSMRPLVEGQERWDGEPHVFLDNGAKALGVRTPDWMMCRDQDGKPLLFDLQSDPEQQNNLYHKPAYADVRAELQVLIDQEAERARAIREGRSAGGSVELSGSDAELLRALGYADVVESAE